MRRLLVAMLLVLLTGGVPAAVAQPTRTHDATPGTLGIYLSTIAPLTASQSSTLTVSGMVTNNGTTPVYAGSVSLDYTGQAASKTELDTFEATPTAGIAMTSKALPSQLAAGRSARFTLSVPSVGRFFQQDLRVEELAVVATGATTKSADGTPLGITAVPVPYYYEAIRAPLRTAVIIPITAAPDQGPVPVQGSPLQPPSPTIISALQPGGRLGKLLSVIEAAPAGGGTGGTQLTVAIDPALLKRVCALAGRCGENMIVGTPPADSETAGDWLKRLFADVELPGVTVVGLPYADADLAALSAAGDTSQVVSILGQAKTVAAAAGATTTTDLDPLLPVDGLADASLTAAAVQAGNTVAVLSSSQFTPFVAAAGEPVTATAKTTLTTTSGTIPVLLTDPLLEEMLARPANDQVSPRLQEQRLLAEFAVVTSEAPNTTMTRTVVLEAPRDWDVPTSFSINLVNALGAVPYIQSEGLETLSEAPPVPRIRLKTPPAPPSALLPTSAVSTVDVARQTVTALKSVAVNSDTETLSAPFADGLDRALSAWWRGDNAAEGATLLASITNDLTTTMDKVSVTGGKNGVLLTGPSGILPVQVSNQLSETIKIVVHVKSDGLDQVTGHDEKEELQPGKAALQVSVPITTRSTRSVSVTVQLLAQNGGAEITAATVTVRSTSVGRVAVGITAAALTLLVLLIVVRGIRRFAAHRRGEPAPTESP